MNTVLYIGNYNASSWAFRAWLALKEQGIEFVEEMVDIRRPQRWQNLAKIGAFSPPAMVPVLTVNDFVIYDSLAIMEYANDCGDGSLLPTDINTKARARGLVAWQHSTFGRICPALFFESAFYHEKKVPSTEERQAIHNVYQVWENCLDECKGDYLVGNYSLADIAFVPSILRLTSHEKCTEQWPNTRAWIKRILNRPYVQEWLEKAYQEEPIYLPGYRNDP